MSQTKKGRYVVITAELVPEAGAVEKEQLEKEIRGAVERTRGLRRS